MLRDELEGMEIEEKLRNSDSEEINVQQRASRFALASSSTVCTLDHSFKVGSGSDVQGLL